MKSLPYIFQQYHPTGTTLDFNAAEAAIRATSATSSPSSSAARKPHRRKRAPDEPRGKPGRKSMDELNQRYRERLIGLWESVQTHRVSLSINCMTVTYLLAQILTLTLVTLLPEAHRWGRG